MEKKYVFGSKKLELNMVEGEADMKSSNPEIQTPETLESMSNITRLQQLQILNSVDRRQFFLGEKAPGKSTAGTAVMALENNVYGQDSIRLALDHACQNPQLKQYQKQRILESLVLQQHVFQWKKIVERLDCSRKEAIQLWQSKIHPKFLLHSKVAGSERWAREQDLIVFWYGKLNGLDENAILLFLPNRSACSIEGRWRRLLKNNHFLQEQEGDEKTVQNEDSCKIMCKYEMQKYVLRKIGARMEQSRRDKNMKEE